MSGYPTHDAKPRHGWGTAQDVDRTIAAVQASFVGSEVSTFAVRAGSVRVNNADSDSELTPRARSETRERTAATRSKRPEAAGARLLGLFYFSWTTTVGAEREKNP